MDPSVSNDTIRELLGRLDAHNPGEAAHAHRVAVYAVASGETLGMSDEELVHLRWAATLHDVGKVSVDAALVRKLGTLDDEELEALRKHAGLGAEVLESSTWLAPALPMIHHHHEWWNGEGYPDGLRGEAIPLGARLIGLAEAYDVLVSDVPWRDRLTEEDAVEEIQACAGSQFDPAAVEAFLAVRPLIQPVDL